MQLDKNFKLTTEEVGKEELTDALIEGAAHLLPAIAAMNKKQLERVLSILVFAPIMEHPTKQPASQVEAIVIMNFLRLQDYKIALVELMDDDLQEAEASEGSGTTD